MYEDQAFGATTYNGSVDFGEWKLVHASSGKILEWLKSSRFNNFSFGDPDIGFVPYPDKWKKLESLKSGQHRDLEITVVWEHQPGLYEFMNGRHRAMWLAFHDAEFVPILVPPHQVAHFKAILE
ncbi:hypothetical protein hmeg3_07465 [Herbaspirillum sp. meg3]|nr:hypothetical protein hmeg3_07465 [Herbaspirillum sp. meg3]